MSVPSCTNPACGRPSPSAFLCTACLHRLEKTLAELPADLRDLEVTVTRQANAGRPEQTKRGKPASSVLYDPDSAAAKVADQARNGLSTWIRHVCEQRGIAVPVIATAPGMACWLTAYAHAIAADEAAGECYVKMHQLRAAIRHAIDNLATRSAGPCTAMVQSRELAIGIGPAGVAVELGEPIGEPHMCGADLRTRTGDAVIRCRSCGARYEPVVRLQWLLGEGRTKYFTAVEAAALLTRAGLGHVTAAQIRGMDKRGHLFAYREDEEGTSLYLLGDLLDLLDHDRRRRVSA